MNEHSIHMQLPKFYLGYSLFSSITLLSEESRILFVSKLHLEGRPFTVKTKSMRLAALQLFLQTNFIFPGFNFIVNLHNGEVSIFSFFTISEIGSKFDDIFYEILMKTFFTLYDRKEDLIRIVNMLSDNIVVQNTHQINLEKNF